MPHIVVRHRHHQQDEVELLVVVGVEAPVSQVVEHLHQLGVLPSHVTELYPGIVDLEVVGMHIHRGVSAVDLVGIGGGEFRVEDLLEYFYINYRR